MKKKEMKDYRLIFPGEMLEDKKLLPIDRFLLALILTYDRGTKGCFASNRVLGEIVNCSVSTVSNSIKKLISLEYIVYNEPNPANGGRSYIRRVHRDLKSHRAS